MSQPAPEAPARPAPAPAPARPRGGGSGTILPLVVLGAGAYLAWFGVKYWRSQSVAWPSDPVKAILQGKPLPTSTPAATPMAQVTAYETTIQQSLAASPASKQAPPPATGGPGPAPGGPPPPANASETLIIRAILVRIGAPQTNQNISSMTAWIRHEQASWPPAAKFNPMNTTLFEPGSTNFNSVGVKNYTSWAQGIEATAQTLTGGYPCIVARFRSGAGVCGTGCFGDFKKWSTGSPNGAGGYSSVC